MLLSIINVIALGSMTFNVLQGDLDVASLVFAFVFVVLAVMGPALALRVMRAGPAATSEPFIDAVVRPLVVGGFVVLLVWMVLLGLAPA